MNDLLTVYSLVQCNGVGAHPAVTTAFFQASKDSDRATFVCLSFFSLAFFSPLSSRECERTLRSSFRLSFGRWATTYFCISTEVYGTKSLCRNTFTCNILSIVSSLSRLCSMHASWNAWSHTALRVYVEVYRSMHIPYVCGKFVNNVMWSVSTNRGCLNLNWNRVQLSIMCDVNESVHAIRE